MPPPNQSRAQAENALGTLGPLIVRALMGQNMAAGPLQPGVPMLTTLRNQQLSAATFQNAGQAAELDQESLIQTVRGLHRLTSGNNAEFTSQHERAARQAARNLTAASPMLAVTAPELLDQIHGSRGSAAGMAVGVTRGLTYMQDRGQYADPRSGGRVTRELFERLYSRGSTEMNGIRATQAGNMFAEMSERGMMSGASSSDQMARRLREMSGAVAAVRDLFGANGQPNAPMRELFSSLDALTQGSSSWMNPGQMQMQIRRVQALTSRTSGGLRQYMQLLQMGGGLADQLGVDRSFAAQSAEASTAFGSAFGNVAGQQGFGGLNQAGATQLDQRLRLSAAGSQQANSLGALMALAEQGQIRGVARGQNGQLRVTGNSEAANMVRSILSRDQQSMSQYAGMNQQQMMQILQQSGVSGATASQFLNSGAANQEQIHQYGIANIVRTNQGQGEIRQAMNSGLQSGMVGVLQERGFAANEIQQFTAIASDAARQALMQMDPQVRSDPARREQRNQLVAQAVSRAVGPGNAARLGPEGMSNLVASAIRSLEGMISRDPRLQQFQNLNGLISMTSGSVQNSANAIQGSAAAEATLGSLTASMGQGTPLSNLMSAVASAGPDTEISQIIAQSLGGQNTQEITAALAGPMQEVQQGVQQYQQLQRQLNSATTPQAREAAQRQLDQLAAQLNPQIQQLQQAAESAGITGMVATGSDSPTGLAATSTAANPGGETPAVQAPSFIASAFDTMTFGLGSYLMRQQPAAGTTGSAAMNAAIEAAGPTAASAEGTAAAQSASSSGNSTMNIRGTLTLRADGNYDLVATPNGVNTTPTPG